MGEGLGVPQQEAGSGKISGAVDIEDVEGAAERYRELEGVHYYAYLERTPSTSHGLIKQGVRRIKSGSSYRDLPIFQERVQEVKKRHELDLTAAGVSPQEMKKLSKFDPERVALDELETEWRELGDKLSAVDSEMKMDIDHEIGGEVLEKFYKQEE